jgi:hypothetical protein
VSKVLSLVAQLPRYEVTRNILKQVFVLSGLITARVGFLCRICGTYFYQVQPESTRVSAGASGASRERCDSNDVANESISDTDMGSVDSLTCMKAGT